MLSRLFSHSLWQSVGRRGRYVLVVQGALIGVGVLPVDLELGHPVKEKERRVY